jgi:type IV pilus assembly protein PilZ
LVELRRYERTPIDIAIDFSRPGSDARSPGRATDISIGGMFIETSAPQAFSTEIVVHLMIPGQRSAMAIPGVVRWARGGGMGVQFRLLGARETHAIMSLTTPRKR